MTPKLEIDCFRCRGVPWSSCFRVNEFDHVPFVNLPGHVESTPLVTNKRKNGFIVGDSKFGHPVIRNYLSKMCCEEFFMSPKIVNWGYMASERTLSSGYPKHGQPKDPVNRRGRRRKSNGRRLCWASSTTTLSDHRTSNFCVKKQVFRVDLCLVVLRIERQRKFFHLLWYGLCFNQGNKPCYRIYS